MAQAKVSIDQLIEIVRNGGKVKTGIDVYNKNNVLLLEQSVLVDSIAVLENIKRSGVTSLPIFPNNAGGLWDENGQSIDFGEEPKPVVEEISFESIPATSLNVEKKLKKISALKKEASENYKKAKTNIKKVLGDIRETGGEFDYTVVEDTVSDLVEYLSKNENGFSYLTKEIFDYDDYLHNHCVNVCTIGTAITTKFNRLFGDNNNELMNIELQKNIGSFQEISSDEMNNIAAGLFLHDIGKVLIPDEILNKKGKLTDEEFVIVRKHSYEKGPEILRKNNITNKVIHDIVTNHHANIFEGEKGCYPNGINTNELPLYVKISKLADIYDAMTSKRCYKEAFNPINVVTDIYRKYAQKDPALQGILYAFVKSIGIYPPGSVIKLISGEYAFIIDSGGPLIIPFTDSSGETIFSQQPAVNLAENTSLAVDTEFPLIAPVNAYDMLPDYLKTITDI